MELLRRRLKVDDDEEGKKLAAVIAAEADAKTKLWLGVLDRVERVVDKVLDRLDKGAVQAAARKALPEPEPEPEQPDITPLLDELRKRPPADKAAALLVEWGVHAENVDELVTMVREAAPEWAQFFDAQPEWLASVVEAVKGTPAPAAE